MKLRIACTYGFIIIQRNKSNTSMLRMEMCLKNNSNCILKVYFRIFHCMHIYTFKHYWLQKYVSFQYNTPDRIIIVTLNT